ncbi:MAG: Phage protein [uncultured Arthrobacter sp.]|uniref:Phage protein n=1 Tax=uncultured Arthrobacter sp. TaxID=114050 RepID=A0A6J4I5Z9_9MICC|nr:lambda exonuclease family protein [uncultured Arthrobacter sp.]CAA9242069.1 MAG: Phage protein [uncultured Arthrobacter sp.]
MTLHIIPDLQQGTDAWHDARRGLITASVVGKLLTPTLKVADNDTSRGITATLAAERICGWTEETGMTPDMWRGCESEPFAREVYAKHFAPVAEVGFMVREEDSWSLGYSPDGLVGDDGLIEIKAPRAKTHLKTILNDAVPDYNMAQLQAGLLVSGRDWIDFVSYCGGMPLFVKRVTPDPTWQQAIAEACISFEVDVAQLVADFEARVAGMPTTERIDFNRVELKL